MSDWSSHASDCFVINKKEDATGVILKKEKIMAKKKKKENEGQQMQVDVLPLYDAVKEKNGNVHPDYCFYHKEWDEEQGYSRKIVRMIDSGICRKIDLNTMCCISYPNPTAVIKPYNPLAGCSFSPVELKKNQGETILKINPLKASKRARRGK